MVRRFEQARKKRGWSGLPDGVRWRRLLGARLILYILSVSS